MNKIITIGREFGSGGREIGRRLSDALGFAYYDQEVIVEIAKRTKLSEQYVQQIMEHRPVTPFPIHFGCSFYHVPSPAWDQNMAIYKEQRDIILEMAQKSDCVIVGRCSDYILGDRPHCIKVFIHADLPSRMRRCVEEYHLPPENIRRHIIQMDRGRANYYSHYTGHSWGDMRRYTLAINSSAAGIAGAADLIASLVHLQMTQSTASP